MPFENDLSRHFHEQSIRMLRTKWKTPHILAQELFAILAHVPDVGTGPVDAQGGFPEIPGFTLPPLGDLSIPPLDLGFLDFPEINNPPVTTRVDFPDPEDPDGGTTGIENTRRYTFREIIPGRIISGGGDTYQVAIYPLGFDGEGLPETDIGGSSLSSIDVDYTSDYDKPKEDLARTVTAKHPGLKGQEDITLPAGLFLWVWRVGRVAARTTTIQDPTGKVISNRTKVETDFVSHVILPLVGRKKQTITQMVAGKVTSGSGDTYEVEIYPKGRDATDEDGGSATETATATHPQMASDARIPVGTWVWVWRVGEVESLVLLTPIAEGQEAEDGVQLGGSSPEWSEHTIISPIWLAPES